MNYRPRYDTTGIMDGVNFYGENLDSGVVIGLDPYEWYTFDVQTFNPAGMGPISELYYAKTYKQGIPLLQLSQFHVCLKLLTRLRTSLFCFWHQAIV